MSGGSILEIRARKDQLAAQSADPEVPVMADPVVAPVAPVAAPAAITPGNQTSEYKLTQIAIAIGVVLQTASVVLASLPQTNKYVAIAGLVCGTLIQVLTALGYVSSRTAVKTAAAASDAASPS
jgi:hypothetical protein